VIPAIELVTWLDAETRDSWRSHEDAVRDMTTGSMEAQAVGFLIAENDDRVVLSGLRTDETSASSVGIPKVAITARVVLRQAKGED